MYNRDIAPILKKSATTFPAVFLTGPRQSGKTTLLKQLFPEHRYISLENPSTLALIMEDPLGFLSQNETSWIIDEAQNFPTLFSYLQGMIDANPKPGKFLLSGSQNFLMHHKISQTLAGRAAVLELLPFRYTELQPHLTKKDDNLWSYIFYGGYPRPRYEKLDYSMWFESYIRTYLERDIRSLIHIRDLSQFQRFIKMCAARQGQILNLTSLGTDCGISQTTAKNWLTFLEASYVVFRIQPYFENFTKRLVKMPKLYFYDTGILCHLLGIESPEHASFHAMNGVLFEGFMMSEIIKMRLNQGLSPNLYYWRDHRGLEIDAILESSKTAQMLEFKSSQTFHKEYINNLLQVQKLSNSDRFRPSLIYGGKDSSSIQNVSILGWQDYLHKNPY